MNEIQDDRVNTAIQYANNIANSNNVIWFLTGGVKNALQNGMTEAKNMANNLKKNEKIILDEKSKNTAENFVYLKKWLKNNTFEDIPNIIITTSKFHKNRAEKIFNGIFKSISPLWNLGEVSCSYCWSDETIHIQNVEKDIENALFLLD